MFSEIGLEENFIYDIVNGIDVFNCSAYKQVEYKKVFDLAMQQRIFPTVYNYLCGKIDQESFMLFEKEKLRLKLKNTVLRYQTKEIVNCFTEHNMRFAISKGMAIAKEIYEEPFLRDMNDIDIVIHSDDYIRGCELLESIGYVLAEETNDKISYFEANRSQCIFVKNGYICVELKDTIQYVWQNHLEQWFDRVEYKEICGITVPVFSTEDMFINILVNSNKNMSTPYGIENDYRIKDLLEFYLFTTKFKDIITEDYVHFLIESHYAHILSCMMDYCKEFFSKENFEKIPLHLRKVHIEDYGIDHVIWKSAINNRFFNKEKRLQEHHLFRFNNYSNNDNEVSYVLNNDFLNVNLSDYAKKNNINIKLQVQFLSKKVKFIFYLKNVKEYSLIMNISDPLSVNERAYRTNIIKFTAKSLEVRSESEDFIEYNKKENKVSILCNSENVLFNDKKCLFVSFELYDLSCKYNSLISCLGGNCRLKKIVLQENSNKD